MSCKIRSLIIGIIIMAASGCDGYYWLVHVPDEGDNSAADSLSYAYSEAKGLFSVRIDGGQTQSPYTRKVQAGDLRIYLDGRCEDSCEYIFPQPSIISGPNVIYPGGLFANFYPLEGDKKKNIFNVRRQKGEDLNEINLAVAPGRVKMRFDYAPYYESLGFLQFPIMANFGYVVCGSDTVAIDSVKFDATRQRPPDSER